MADEGAKKAKRFGGRGRFAIGVAALAAVLTSLMIWPGVPGTVGVTAGTLSPCPGTPNCVHTGLRHPDGTRGMFLQGRILRGEIISELVAVVGSMPRTRIVSQTDRYIHAEVRSQWFRFVDDLELYVADDRELIVRSASRVGRGDLGVNAARVTDLRTRLVDAGLVR